MNDLDDILGKGKGDPDYHPDPSRNAIITVKGTGEVLSLPIGTTEEIVDSFNIASDYAEAYRKLRNMLMETAMQVLGRNNNKGDK